MEDRTRYQILGSGKDEKRPIENFTASERVKFQKRQKALKAAGISFTTWDCRNNSLANMFKGVFND